MSPGTAGTEGRLGRCLEAPSVSCGAQPGWPGMRSPSAMCNAERVDREQISGEKRVPPGVFYPQARRRCRPSHSPAA